MDARELLMTGVRGLAVIRVLGKRTIGNLTAFDLLVALTRRSRGRDDLRRRELRAGRGRDRRHRGRQATAIATCRSRTGEWRLGFDLRREKGVWRIAETSSPR